MLAFRSINLDDKAWIAPYFKEKNFYSAKYSFASCYVWRDVYQLEAAQQDGFLYMKIQAEGMDAPAFLCPIGRGDLAAAVELLHQDCRAKGLETRIYGIFDAEKAALEAAFGQRLLLEANRDDFDYIYDREKLATLSGKKLHGKRNHIARFQDKPWHYEPLNRENVARCLEMHMEWSVQNQVCNEHSAIWQESCASIQALTHFEELGFCGGVLYQENRVVAYTIGEPLTTDCYAVHFEKAFPDVQGAYPMINQQFILHETEGFRYVNREEDTGDEGLRKAKLSYQPEILLTEYAGVLRDA